MLLMRGVRVFALHHRHGLGLDHVDLDVLILVSFVFVVIGEETVVADDDHAVVVVPVADGAAVGIITAADPQVVAVGVSVD